MTEGSTQGGPVVGIVGGSRSDFPTLEEAVAVLGELGVIVGAQGRLGAPDAGSPVPLRGGRRRPRDQGDHRRRRRGRPPARDARREDGPPGHRRPDPDPAPRRARLAAVDRPDAAGRAGRHGRDRQCHQCRAARGRDPGALAIRVSPSASRSGVPPDPGRPRRALRAGRSADPRRDDVADFASNQI